jgi:hypothetical protein
MGIEPTPLRVNCGVLSWRALSHGSSCEPSFVAAAGVAFDGSWAKALVGPQVICAPRIDAIARRWIHCVTVFRVESFRVERFGATMEWNLREKRRGKEVG